MEKIIKIIVKTNSKVNEILDSKEGLIIKTKELPTGGRANKAIIEILSKYFKIPKRNIGIIKGLKSKEKLIKIKIKE